MIEASETEQTFPDLATGTRRESPDPAVDAPAQSSSRPWPANIRKQAHRLFHFLTFGAPAMVVYLGFVLVPMALTIRTSTTDRNSYRPQTHFLGVDNYIELAHDADFLQTLRNTMILAAIVTIVPNVLGLAIAQLLDRKGWVFNALRAVFFIPVVLSSVVVSVIWESILTDDGLLNTTLHQLGVQHAPGWLSDPNLAMYSIASVMSWQALGFSVVIYLAGLQGVPHELQEAAAIDGAGSLMRFRKVTWPMLAPAVTINVVIALINGFKAYDQVQVLTNGGPGTGTTATLAFGIVQTGINGIHVGYASAMATIMLALIAVVSIVMLRLLQRREVEQ